jgi:hypothetical protein
MSLRIMPWESCDRCRGVPALRRLDELREARQPAQQATGRDARESGPPGGYGYFPHAATCSDSSVSNTHFVGTA